MAGEVQLLQKTEMISGVSFMTAHVAYATTNKTRIVWIVTEVIFLAGADVPHVYLRAWTLCCK